MKQLDIPWRRCYESYSAIGWTVALFTTILFLGNTAHPRTPMIFLAGFMALVTAIYWYRANTVWSRKNSLQGKAKAFITPKKLMKWMDRNPDKLFLGYGYSWERVHTQTAYDVKKADTELLKPPFWYRWLFGARDLVERGAHWIHGLHPHEMVIAMPYSHREGNTVLLGTTGAGKTVAINLIIFQDVVRVLRQGGACLLVDPKGDQSLQKTLKLACQYCGRPEAFLFFHPAFPTKSVRIDPLAQWSRATELATRIIDVMPTENEAGGDAFAQFAWRAINIVVQGMRICRLRPNLRTLKLYIEGGIEELLKNTLKKYLDENIDNWAHNSRHYHDVDKTPRIFNNDKNLFAMTMFYKNEVRGMGKSNEAINGMINMFEHDAVHYSKMIQNLLPTLEMLTADSLGDLLSPSADSDDDRLIVTGKSIIEGGYCVYIGLDSLPDRTVSGAIGSILLSDLASVAGDLYNRQQHSDASKKKPIYLFIEEMNEVANLPMVNLLNKSRGCGFIISSATQTFSDLVVRLGDEHKARMALGNFNNLIALRSIDGETQKLITETFGTTMIMTTMHEQKTQSIGSDRDVTNFSGGYGERLIETPDTDVFPQELLAQLPDLEYMARISGGTMIKGRVPILLSDEEHAAEVVQSEDVEVDDFTMDVVDIDTPPAPDNPVVAMPATTTKKNEKPVPGESELPPAAVAESG